ncbi:hypothetical protein RRG08_014486 [Elysia crispata]|uniref:Uncharacterized protein n=1 Tax=Elysia crispata TaxID=231223 RepID=A0AAE0XSL7_9GAST|nr:hypothetical protein RRG08_014486 [Elysia crispata]
MGQTLISPVPYRCDDCVLRMQSHKNIYTCRPGPTSKGLLGAGFFAANSVLVPLQSPRFEPSYGESSYC